MGEARQTRCGYGCLARLAAWRGCADTMNGARCEVKSKKMGVRMAEHARGRACGWGRWPAEQVRARWHVRRGARDWRVLEREGHFYELSVGMSLSCDHSLDLSSNSLFLLTLVGCSWTFKMDKII